MATTAETDESLDLADLDDLVRQGYEYYRDHENCDLDDATMAPLEKLGIHRLLNVVRAIEVKTDEPAVRREIMPHDSDMPITHLLKKVGAHYIERELMKSSHPAHALFEQRLSKPSPT